MNDRKLLGVVIDQLDTLATADDDSWRAGAVKLHGAWYARVRLGNVVAFKRLPDDYNFIPVVERLELMNNQIAVLVPQVLGQTREKCLRCA